MGRSWKLALASLLALACSLGGIFASRYFLQKNQARAQDLNKK
jgi:hypothetical protein